MEKRRTKCKKYGIVRQETFEWLARNAFYTKRFVWRVGKRCQTSSIKDVAEEFQLSWRTVKDMEKKYLEEKLKRSEEIGPEIIGIDEISIRKGHTYKIVVSDLIRKRPIWFDGEDRSEESMNLFYEWLGHAKCKRIRLAVMDMWKAFEKSARKYIPQAAILYDKFHIIRHLQEALNQVRIDEYKRVSEKNRNFIKGQKYTLLSKHKNLSTDGKEALKTLLAINKKIHIAYMLKESFAQLWDYKSEAWARKFFDNWKESLKWQRLKPYKEFVKLIERHWDGIAAYCKEENKVSLGFVEGLNNKIRVIQRRAYGIRDQEYLRLKVLTCMLPEIDLNPPT